MVRRSTPLRHRHPPQAGWHGGTPPCHPMLVRLALVLGLVAATAGSGPAAAGSDATRPSRTGEEIDVLPPAEIVLPEALVGMEQTWAFWADAEDPPPAWPLLVAPSDAAPLDTLLVPDELGPDRTVLFGPAADSEAAGRWWSETHAPFSAYDSARHDDLLPELERNRRARSRKGKSPVKRTLLVLPAGAIDGGGRSGPGDGEGPPGECWNTLYFGKTFQVDDPDTFAALQLESRFSGGVVVYLNGAEIARYNLDPGDEGHDLPATPFWLPDPVNQLTYNRWQRTWLGIDPSLLLPGENVLSAEVHRRPDESELPFHFDLRLDAYREAGLTRSPYLQDVTGESITVVWETNVPAYGHVEYGKLGSRTRYVVKPPAIPDTQHEVVIGGLRPDTEYVYRVYAHPVPLGPGGGLSPEFASRLRTFRTAAEEGSPFTFLAYGDSRGVADVHAQLVELMWEEVQLADARFVLNTGDLVSHGSPRQEWQKEFFEAALPLMGFVPYYTVLGNHELNHESYYANFALPGNESWYSFRYGDVEFFALNTNTSFKTGSEQLEWLVEAFEASEATWKVVFFHHPPFSCTPSRKPGNKRVRKVLVPLFEEYGVDLVFLGHDHLYGRSRDVDGVRYVITGGGGASTYPGQPDAVNEVCVRKYHYCRIDVFSDALELVAIDIEGEELDRLLLLKE